MNTPPPKDKPRALGRGLDALLPVSSPRKDAGSREDSGLFLCPIERIVPQKGQPRQHFDGAAIEELAASLSEHGLLEPLVVRKVPGDKFELIAGERRWRAAQKAGMHDVPVVVKDVSPARAFELALVENVQRADLNPIELAEALERLIKEHGHTHEALASVLKKDRTTITNSLRLLKLPARVRRMVIDGRLTEGHGRCLLGAPDEKSMEAIADAAVNGRLNVRQVEELVRKAKTKLAPKGPEPKGPDVKTPAVRDLEMRLARRLGSKVLVRDRKGKGEIVVAYGSLDELDRILALIERLSDSAGGPPRRSGKRARGPSVEPRAGLPIRTRPPRGTEPRGGCARCRAHRHGYPSAGCSPERRRAATRPAAAHRRSTARPAPTRASC